MHTTRLTRLTLLPILALACGPDLIVEGDGTPAADPRAVPAFDGIEIRGSQNAYVTVGKPQAVTVNCDSNLLPYIKTRTSGTTLIVDTEDNTALRPQSDCDVHINVPTAKALRTYGSGTIVASYDRAEQAAQVKLASHGSGEIRATGMLAFHVEARTLGSGDMTLHGVTTTFSAETNGSGDIHARDLLSGEVELQTRGSGDITAHADQRVHARSYGSGDIRVHGNPPAHDTRSLGSGDIVLAAH